MSEAEVTTRLLTQRLNEMLEQDVDALINSFLCKGDDLWMAIPRAPLGDKINRFVEWTHTKNKVDEAYWRTIPRPTRIRVYKKLIDEDRRLIDDYLTTTLPAHLEEVSGVGKVGRPKRFFSERSADEQQQRGVRAVLLDPDLPSPIDMSAEFFAPGEGTAVYIPDIRQRLRELPQVALLGEPGAGKSFLLARLALDYAQDYETTSILPVFVPLSKYSTDQAFETFVAGRLGPVAELLPGMQVVWLLDALNEMPRSHGQWEHLGPFLLGLVRAKTRFVLTCRVKNYTTELAYVDGLYRVDLQDLNPQQIYDILERYLAEEDVVEPRLQGEPAVDRIWKEVLHGDGLLEAWQNWTGSVRAFWERPEGYSWRWDDNERARQAVHDDPRKLMLLCRNPFILVRLLMRRICTVVAASDISPQNWQSALRMYLPNNRAELFGMVIEGMLAEEA